MKNGTAEYVILNVQLGCLCRWSEKDKTLYSAYGVSWSGAPTLFASRNEARKAMRAAVRFWNSPKFRFGFTAKREWLLLPLRRKNGKKINNEKSA